MPDLPPLAVSISEAVRLSGLGRSSVYAAIKRGALPIRKAGRRTLIELDALRAWVAALPGR